MKKIKTPAPKKAPESVLAALKNKGNIICRHCGKPLDLNNLKIITPQRAAVKCAVCGKNNFLQRIITARGLHIHKDGVAHREHPKKKMTKKDRKKQRKIEKGWA